MPASKRLPKYCHHKATDQAYVTLDGKVSYLGKYNTQSSRERYREAVNEWLLRHAQNCRVDLTVGELVLQYWDHVNEHYQKAGKRTSEVLCIRAALRYITKYYGIRVAEFGPLKLKECRKLMVTDGQARLTINRHVWRIRKMFSWGVENELVPETVANALDRVQGLQAGRTTAPESEPVRPVSLDAINAVKPHVSAPVWGAIKTQLYAAMRPGEVLAMRGMDLDTSGEVWIYTPESHKNQHHGKRRVIYLGPKAQGVIREFLKDDPKAYLFSPRDVREIVEGRVRQPGERYNIHSYRNAIKRACELAFNMPKELRHISRKVSAEERERLKKLASAWRAEFCWHPHQLRHTAATLLRREADLDSARVILGHTTLRTTEVYAEMDATKARDIIARVG